MSNPLRGAKLVPKTRLTDIGLRSFPAPKNGTIDYWDSSLPNFGCRVSQGGARTFILKLDNSRRAIGRFPIISLSEARTEAKRLLAEKTLGKVRPQSITFQHALEVFLQEKTKSRRPNTVANLRDRLTRHFLLRRQLADITHQDIARRLGQIKTNSEHDHALSVAKTFFTWAVNRRYISDNPARGLSPRGHTSRARVLTDKELKAVWKAAEQIGGHFGAITKLLICLGSRRGEISALRWSWISDERITFPASIMKNGREHWIPLLPFTKSIIHAVSKTGELLFPARGYTDRPFNGWSKAFVDLKTLSGVQQFTLHDIRRSWTSINAAWTPPHILERALSHVSGQISGVAAVYNRFAYERELTACFQSWEAHLSTILKIR